MMRSPIFLLCGAAAALLTAAPANAQSTVLVDQFTLNGTVLMTGNTLGRSGYGDIFDSGNPGLEDRPGIWHSAFTWIADTSDAPSENANWGPYTTGDWRDNFSFGELDLVSVGGGTADDYRVVQAWLVWGGSCIQSTADVSAYVDDPVVLDYPLGSGRFQKFVYPDHTQDQCGDPLPGYTIEGYSNWADVTDLVEDWVEGMYGVGQVPGTQNFGTVGFAGWTLVVVVENPTAFTAPHQVTVWRGWVPPAISESATPTEVDGFCYPVPENEGPQPGRLLVTAAEGDANIYGDYLLFGNSPTFDGMAGTWKNVMWGRRNALENFFGSQIVDRYGGHITGGVNYTPVDHDPWTGFDCWLVDDFDDVGTLDDGVDPDCLKAGARQGWDIANIPINDTNGDECEGGVACNPGILDPGDTTAYLLPMTRANASGTAPNGDEYVVLGMALDLPTYSASLSTATGGVTHESTITVNPGAGVSDTITYEAVLKNEGEVTATEVTWTHAFPANVTSLESFDYQVLGGPSGSPSLTLSQLASGVALPDLPPGVEVEMTYTVRVTDFVPADPIVTRAQWSWEWSSCAATNTAAGETGDLVVDIDHCVDVDLDGLCRDVEDTLGTSDSDQDSDDDGIRDDIEVNTTGTDPARADTDGDGVQDGTELGWTNSDITADTDLSVFRPDGDPTTTTDPNDPDTDEGGSKDGVEDEDLDGRVDVGECDPNDPNDDDLCLDSDGDGLSDDYEDTHGLDKNDADTDDDGLSDGYEVGEGYQADNPDSDGDGLLDGLEEGLTEPQTDDTDLSVFVADSDPGTRTDPLDPDTDDDGLDDDEEDLDGDGAVDPGETRPTDDDSDEDGLKDGYEVDIGIDPLDNDTDDDGILDGTEMGLDEPQGNDTNDDLFVPDADPSTTTDPNDTDTDDGGVPDGEEDDNHNGRIDPGETDPRDPTDDFPDEDCDGDGLTDAEEIAAGTDPCDPDSDGDGLPDAADGLEDHDDDGLIDALDTDSDNDGFPDGVEDTNHDGVVDPGETDPDSPDYLQGSGGCDTNGVPAGGAAVLLLGALALTRRRKAAAAALPLLLLAPIAQAQESTEPPLLDIQRFDPAPNPLGFTRVLEPELQPFATWGVGLLVNYAYHPFELGGVDYSRTQGLIDHMIGVDVTASVTWFRGFQLGASMPVFQWEYVPDESRALVDALGHTDAQVGIGDLTVVQSIQIISQRRHGFSLAVAPFVVMPTGTRGIFTGQGTWAPGGHLMLGYAWPVFRFAFTGGYQFNASSRTIGSLHPDDEVKVGLGLGFIAGRWEIDVEATAATGVSPYLKEEVGAGVFDASHTPVELLLVVRPPKAGIVEGLFGGGPGLTKGFGTPDARAVAGLRLTNARRGEFDSDGDGILDADDDCPLDPEDFDGFQDEDGCPDDDNDQDGILDAWDDCPELPEVYNGIEDDDGCPERDTDGDGIVDQDDLCPDVPEDMDGWQDDDGCPDNDNDDDGILDIDDACPDRPETFNDYEDDDGCPDSVRVVVTSEQIEILDAVYFDYNKATIKPVSFGILDAVADTLYAHPEIHEVEVQGHTDWDGSDEFNQELSERRAAAVVDYLVGQGIDRSRLVAKGYGESVPIATNETEEGKAKNRRVEFHILDSE